MRTWIIGEGIPCLSLSKGSLGEDSGGLISACFSEPLMAKWSGRSAMSLRAVKNRRFAAKILGETLRSSSSE
jgi:hypothetical protein